MWASLSCYSRIAVAGFHRYSTYRQATLAGLCTNLFFGMIKIGILSAVFISRNGSQINGYDLTATITFVWIGQGLLNFVQLWYPLALSERIRTGDVVIDLTRPWNVQLALLAEDIGRAGYSFITRFIPAILFGILFFPFHWPDNPLALGMFAVSLLLALALSFSLRFLLSLWTFWLLDPKGAERMYSVVVAVLSGLEVPLVFFPSWAQNLLWFLPFPGMLQDPINIFVQQGSATATIIHQACWAGLLAIAGHLVLKKAMRKVVVQGG